MPTIAEHCPTQSKGAGRDGERPTFVSRYSATSPTGKLMKKTMRQLSSVRKPPTTGPADEATAAPSDQIAIARARCLALEYDSRIRASDAGWQHHRGAGTLRQARQHQHAELRR